MAIVKSAPAAATEGVRMRRDAAAPVRPVRTDAPNPRLVIFFKSRLGVRPPCLIAYSSSVTVPRSSQMSTVIFFTVYHKIDKRSVFEKSVFYRVARRPTAPVALGGGNEPGLRPPDEFPFVQIAVTNRPSALGISPMIFSPA